MELNTRYSVLGFLVAGLMACSGSGSTSPTTTGTGTGNPAPSGANDVTVQNNSFSPAAKTVTPGTTVNWTWSTCTSDYAGQNCVSHNVTFDDGVASATQGTGSFSRAFAAAGSYKYHCTVHGISMSGTITVQ